MLNLKHYSRSAADFLTDVIKRKRITVGDPTYKTRLLRLESEVTSHFGTYDNSFNADSLQSLAAAGYSGQDKIDLLELYSYQSSIMQKLKQGVTTVELKRVVSTCQNCTISEVNSFDHLIPKDEFPEFAVHPKNLFPSCSRCNSHKSKIWRENGNRLFLNLYLDQLPSVQYLFVNVNVRPGDIEATFSINNPFGISTSLYDKISYHYRKLLLCERFTENIDKVVTPLKHSISSSLSSLSMAEVVNVAMKTIDRNRNAFGFNYWKSILELELLSNPAFLQMCENEQ